MHDSLNAWVSTPTGTVRSPLESPKRSTSGRWTRSCPTRNATKTRMLSWCAAVRVRTACRAGHSTSARYVPHYLVLYSPFHPPSVHVADGVRCRQRSHIQPSGLTCPQCHAAVGMASVQTQLEVQIREHIAKYYENWTVCDDSTCGNRTRMMGVYGRRCLRPGCRGSVTFEVGVLVVWPCYVRVQS